MKKVRIVYTASFLYFLLNGCGSAPVEETTVTSTDSIGAIEIYDPAAYKSIDSNATIEIIARGFTWSEGPVWLADQQLLIFSDVPENKIYQWKEGDTAKLYLMPSGYTQTVERIGGENGSNGLALDKTGRLLLCQSGNRQIARMNAALTAPEPEFIVLSAGYNNKKFNSPNDLVADSKNNIYFTDPIYGLPQGENDSTRELDFEGVYKIGTDGKTVLLIDSIPRPNGIALSADEKKLYIASSDDKHAGWFAYDMDDNGLIKSGGILLDATSLKDKADIKQGADGFKIDRHENIFSSGPDGINIISPAGKRLGLIKIFGKPTSNCAFNTSGDILYVTADDVVLKVTLHP